MIRTLPSKWGPVALVCRKCGKKLGGGFGRKGRQDLVDAVKRHLKESGNRRALRVVETGCLGLCPKGAVAVALSDRVLLVGAGTEPEEVVRGCVPVRSGITVPS